MFKTTIDDNYLIGVLGTGTMGRGIVQVAAEGGMRVRLADSRPGAAAEAKDFSAKMILRGVEKGRMKKADADRAVSRMEVVDSVEGLKGCDLVIEAVKEDIEVKKAVFVELERICGPDAVLVSNTSSLLVSEIGSNCKDQTRVAGFHFFNPVPLMALVEVIDSAKTDPRVADLLMEVGRRMGRTPVRAKDSPGFLVNHNGRAFYAESLRILQERIATTADIDRIVRDAGDYRMGPFELMDLTGADVNFPAAASMFQQWFADPKYRTTVDHRQRYLSNLWGRKSGEGWYGYKDGQMVLPPEPEAPKELPERIWIWAAEDDWSRRLVDLARAKMILVEQGPKPTAGTLSIVAPLGEDATTTATRLGIDPAHTVAVEMLYGWDKRRTVMAPPGADEGYVRHGIAFLASDGVKVTRISDSPGFVMPRIQAAITNMGSDLCQMQIATPDDLDLALRLALNYPEGPLEAGDRIGPKRVLMLLEAMQAFYGDDRYRPSPWLKRRAMLGQSLKTLERAPAPARPKKAK